MHRPILGTDALSDGDGDPGGGSSGCSQPGSCWSRGGVYRFDVGGRRVVLNAVAQRVTDRLGRGDPRGSEAVRASDGELDKPVAESERIPTSPSDAFTEDNEPLAEAEYRPGRTPADPLARRVRAYSLAEVRRLVEGYAVLRQSVRWSHRGPSRRGLWLEGIEARLLDLERALARLPPDAFQIVAWLGLWRLTVDEAEALTGIARSTLHDRYGRALKELVADLNAERDNVKACRAMVDWTVDQNLCLALPLRRPTREGDRPAPRGRPPEIAPELEQRILELYASGETLRSIAALLNERGVPAPRGTEWRPTSFRNLLARNGISPRPRGRHPRAGAIGVGGSDVGRSNYAERRREETGQTSCPKELFE